MSFTPQICRRALLAGDRLTRRRVRRCAERTGVRGPRARQRCSTPPDDLSTPSCAPARAAAPVASISRRPSTRSSLTGRRRLALRPCSRRGRRSGWPWQALRTVEASASSIADAGRDAAADQRGVVAGGRRSIAAAGSRKLLGRPDRDRLRPPVPADRDRLCRHGRPAAAGRRSASTSATRASRSMRDPRRAERRREVDAVDHRLGRRRRARSPARLAEPGLEVVASRPAAHWPPADDFATDETAQAKLFWTDERLTARARPDCLRQQQLGHRRRRLDAALHRLCARAPQPDDLRPASEFGVGRRLADRLRRPRALL